MIKFRTRPGLAVAVTLVVAGLGLTETCSAQAAPAVADEPEPSFDASYLSNADNIKLGETVWTTQCRHCHGNSAYPGKAPKLKPGMMEPGFIFDRVTYGFKGMPPWRAVFSREQRMGVVAYIKSDSFSP